MDALTFLQSVAGYTQAQAGGSADRPIRSGIVDPAYPGPPALPRVIFDGEEEVSGKEYAYVHTVRAGDRVTLLPAGTTYVIVAAVGGPSNPRPVQVNDSTVLPVSSTSPVPGSPVVGTTFRVPPSGLVYVTVTGKISISNVGFEIQLGWELRQGDVVSAGAVHTTPSGSRAVIAGRAVVSGGPAVNSASNRYLAGLGATLNPGGLYNVRAVHLVTGGGGTVEYRSLLIEPVL